MQINMSKSLREKSASLVSTPFFLSTKIFYWKWIKLLFKREERFLIIDIALNKIWLVSQKLLILSTTQFSGVVYWELTSRFVKFMQSVQWFMPLFSDYYLCWGWIWLCYNIHTFIPSGIYNFASLLHFDMWSRIVFHDDIHFLYFRVVVSNRRFIDTFPAQNWIRLWLLWVQSRRFLWRCTAYAW